MALNLVRASTQYLIRGTGVATARPIGMVCWFKPTTLVSANLMSVCANGSDKWNRFLHDGGGGNVVYNAVFNGGEDAAAGATIAATGSWHHVAGIWSAANLGVYVDGAETLTTASQNPTTFDRTMIGGVLFGAAPTDTVNGRLAEVAIWDLSDASWGVNDAARLTNWRLAVADLYAFNTDPLDYPGGLVGYWCRNGSTNLAGLLVDHSGNSADMTAVNTPTWVSDEPAAPIVPTTLPVNDANWYRPPLCYVVNGSTDATTNVFPSGSRLKVGPTANGTLNLDCSAMSTGRLKITYSVDGGPWQDVIITSATTTIAMLAAGSSGTHTFEWKVSAQEGNVDRWNTPALALVETGFDVDSGATTTNWPPTQSKLLMSYGDSIGEGIGVLADPVDIDDNSVVNAYPLSVALALDAVLANRCIGGGGWITNNSGNTPKFWVTADAGMWDKYFSGEDLLDTPAPDYVIVTYGRNDVGDITTAVSSWLTDVRAFWPDALVVIVVPFGQSHLSQILAGLGSHSTTTVNDMSLHRSSGDPLSFVADLGTNMADGIPDTFTGASSKTTDGVHLNLLGQAEAATRITRMVLAAIALVNGGGSGGGLLLSGGMSGGFQRS